MTLSDEELERDWKPNGRRPQSTIARSFSAELMDIFRIENSVADLDEKVDKRRQELSERNSELEAIEARLKEMENRLRQRGSPPNSTGPSSSSPRTHARPAMEGAFQPPMQQRQQRQDGPPSVPEKDSPSLRRTESREGAAKYGSSRPGTARAPQQAVPGALPPTPTASEDGDREMDA